MALSARLRYEILRRDGFRCQACGASPSEQPIELHVDHVVPLALGGTDDATNLQALCQACNLGKGSTSPSDSHVDTIVDKVEEERVAVESYATHVDEVESRFRLIWEQHGPDQPLIDEVGSTVDQLLLAGASWSLIERGVRITGDSWSPGRARPFGYFIGVMRKLIDSARSGTRWWA